MINLNFIINLSNNFFMISWLISYKKLLINKFKKRIFLRNSHLKQKISKQ